MKILPLTKALKLRSHWVGKNVDLALLSKRVEVFFRDKGFNTRINESTGEYRISVMSQYINGVREDVDVKISGNPDDFVIDLLVGERARSSIRFGFITGMFGGGSLLLRGLKSNEALEKLEEEFWMYVEESVGYLTNSAVRPSKTRD